MNYRYPFMVAPGGNWSVGYQTASQISGLKIIPLNIITHQQVNSSTTEEISYIADPFFIRDEGTFYLFTEIKGKDNANIALFTSEDGVDYSYNGIVLDETFHLSYPQVFRHEEDFYMLPETKGANQVLLYKAEKFPYSWKVEDTLIKDRALKDASILLSDDLNLIVTVDDKLKQIMFTADSLTGKWKEVKEFEPRWGNESRPGGRFVSVDEVWYLPLQNHSEGYGTGISLYKLLITSEAYKFELADKLLLKPQEEIKWFGRGMHHLDAQQMPEGGYYMVYDGNIITGEDKELQYKRAVKWNLVDLYNYLGF
ncbi:glucosamine inositolphosphorylceramide transferase family protein [Salinimicrobium sp. WS361]|uniref:glucosamine inositolphosphorylceramide transferase family protein n=1 Tax=Salinimicrobium sp. WS361 TaxID=3425123 RepID=UPI003D6F13F5